MRPLTSVCDIHSVFDDSAQWQSSKDPLAKLIDPLPVRIRVLHAKLLVEPVRLSARSGLVVSPREKDTARITKLGWEREREKERERERERERRKEIKLIQLSKQEKDGMHE